MEDALLERFQKQLESKESWRVSELADFLDVSNQTVRRRIEDGTITATKKETSSGHYWEIPAEEIRRNIAQEDKLQHYLTQKVNNGANSPPQAAQDGEHAPQSPQQDGNTVAALLDRIERLEGKVEGLQDTVAELREDNGKLRAERDALEKQLEDLRAELEDRPHPKALPAAIEEGHEDVLQAVGWWSSTLESRLRRQLENGGAE